MAADETGARLSGPPPPLPKRQNAVWRLFDAPLYRDWLFWFMVAWVAIAFVSILANGQPSGIPVWLNAVFGALFFALIAGIIPAWVRLLIRRQRWQRQQAKTARRPTQQAGGQKGPGEERSHRAAFASVRARGSGAAGKAGPAPDTPEDEPTGLGITAADPALVGIDEQAQAKAARSSVPLRVRWNRLNADGFERLLTRILEQSGAYVRITRLMSVNAADAGRDIQAYRRVHDDLVSERYERVIVQAKHWPKRGVSASDIADLVHAKLPLWEGEPIRGLIVATTGSFTQDAVRWVDDHNRAAKRPDIVLWSSSELEALLRRWPAVGADLGLVD